ncbi:hypothetical protein [Chitinophaga japonensis]|uniref:hypothetical protein n=1 Tax=Chitinophaga japonensis TaxID=104662 RepID=UPI0013152A9E|nr:hypothetical protein [Chitinophaga japonensis]
MPDLKRVKKRPCASYSGCFIHVYATLLRGSFMPASIFSGTSVWSVSMPPVKMQRRRSVRQLAAYRLPRYSGQYLPCAGAGGDEQSTRMWQDVQ